MTTTKTGLVIELLSAEDLLRYGRPTTSLEFALFDRLKDTLSKAEEWEEAANTGDQVACTPADLEKNINILEEIEAKPDDYDALRTFFDDIVATYNDIGQAWPCADPSDQDFINAVCDDIRAVSE